MSKSLLRSTTIFSCNTFLSRMMGFVRDMVFAYIFGAVAGFDAFIVAFKIPQFLRRLFAEGAFSQAFVPVLSEYRTKKSPEEVQRFINDTTGMLSLVLSIVTLIAVFIAPLIVMAFAPGFLHSAVRFTLASHMLRITFPYLFLISITALCSAILNTYDSFGIPAFAPVLLNVVLILMAVVFARFFSVPVYALAWGVPIAGAAQLIFQLPFLYQKKLMPIPRLNFHDKGVRRVLKLMVPAIFGVSVAQLSILIDTTFASFLKVGSVSWLYYSERLMNFPLGVFGVAIATVILPKLSLQHAKEDGDGYSKTLDWSIRLLLLIGVPSTVFILILSGPLLSSLFQYGHFTAYDVVMARKSLIAYAIGIQFFMLIKVFASGFYARQNIKTPVKIAIIALICNMLFNVALIFPLAHAGLALSTTLAAIINSSLLFILLLRRGYYRLQEGWSLYLFQLGLATIIMTVLLWYFTPPLSVWMSARWPFRFLHLAELVLLGGAGYLLTLYFSGLKLKEFRIH